MTTKPEQLLTLLNNNPQEVEFQAVMTVIAEYYDYTPTQFSNGPAVRL